MISNRGVIKGIMHQSPANDASHLDLWLGQSFSNLNTSEYNIPP